jgi:hypothetical protein
MQKNMPSVKRRPSTGVRKRDATKVAMAHQTALMGRVTSQKRNPHVMTAPAPSPWPIAMIHMSTSIKKVMKATVAHAPRNLPTK